MTYAYPNNTMKLVDLAIWVNNSTSGVFWPLILLGLFVILFISFKSYSTERAFVASSWITCIIAILFGIIGLVNSYIVILTAIIAAISVLVIRSSNNREY